MVGIGKVLGLQACAAGLWGCEAVGLWGCMTVCGTVTLWASVVGITKCYPLEGYETTDHFAQGTLLRPLDTGLGSKKDPKVRKHRVAVFGQACERTGGGYSHPIQTH